MRGKKEIEKLIQGFIEFLRAKCVSGEDDKACVYMVLISMGYLAFDLFFGDDK